MTSVDLNTANFQEKLYFQMIHKITAENNYLNWRTFFHGQKY